MRETTGNLVKADIFKDRMKLSAHQAASYVIARKGQGFVDKLVS